MRNLPADEIEWLRDRQLDLNGRVFRFEGQIYRAIYPQRVEHVRSLFERGIVRELVDEGLLIPSEITDLTLRGFGLVLKHRRLAWRTKPFEWPRSLLRDAAVRVLDLNLALSHHGLGTVDGHGGNLGQSDGCAPIWVDFGSLMPLTDLEEPLAEFRRFFLHPLRLLARAPGASLVVREIVRGCGLDEETMAALLHPRFSPLRWAPLVRMRIHDRLDWLRSLRAKGVSRTIDTRSRQRLFRAEKRRVLALRLPLRKTTWASYHHNALPIFPPDYTTLGEDVRRAAIFGVLREIKPRRVIDLAANAGFFSFYAARQGAEVLAMDYDEAAVELCYRTAREHAGHLPLACVCGDVMEAPPVERNGDFVLALALMHHLALSQGFTFDAIAAALARTSTDTLLVEFMPNGLGGTRPQPDPLPDWYRLDAFLESLQRHFTRSEVIEYPVDPKRNRRILILAGGRRA